MVLLSIREQAHEEKKDQTRSGFRNAEPDNFPGGEESERSAPSAASFGTTASTEPAPAARKPTQERLTRVVATASTDAVSQLCAGFGDIPAALVPGTAESALS